MQFNTEQSTDMKYLHIRLSFTAIKSKHLKGKFEATKTLVKINLKNYLVTLKLPPSHKMSKRFPASQLSSMQNRVQTNQGMPFL